MQAIQIQEPQKLRTIQIEEPGPPGPGQALVRTHRMGVCGTDVSSYLGKFPFFDYPRIPGHELGVEVIQVGPDVQNVRPGDRCTVEPYMNCGDCYACRKGAINCCEKLSVIGIMCDGGLCERFLVRANKLHPSGGLSFDQLALVETLAIGYHANQRAPMSKGDHALIIGLGPIGLATLEFARLTGAEITVMDREPSRLEFCRKTYGIDNAILYQGDQSELDVMRQITNGDMYAVVADATGSPQSMAGALRYIAHTGTLVFVGLTTSEISFSQPLMHRPELTLKATRNALPDDFRQIIKLIEQGAIDTAPWVTHRTNLDTVVDDFESFTRPESGVVKAMIDVC